MSEPKRYLCPACETVELEQRQELGVVFVVCPDCFGAFFTVDHLCAYLNESIGDEEAEIEFRRLLAESLAHDEPDGAVTRSCIECSSPLQRFGFGEHPLVIADRCSEHGLWLDHRDMPRIERQVRVCLHMEDVADSVHGEAPQEAPKPKKVVAPPDHKVVCPNCHRRYPEAFVDQRCEDCNVPMYMD